MYAPAEDTNRSRQPREQRLPAIPGLAETELRQPYRDAPAQRREEHPDVVSWFQEQYRQDVRQYRDMLAKKDEHYRDMLAKKDEQYRHDMKEKDGQNQGTLATLAKKDELHREDMAKKDAQVERLLAAASLTSAGMSAHQVLPPTTHTAAQQQQQLIPFPPSAVPASSSTSRDPPAPTAPARIPSGTVGMPAERLLAQLKAGADECEAMLTAVAEHALEVLEMLQNTTPRKRRKPLKTQCERIEVFIDAVDGDLVERLALCEAAELERLSEHLRLVHGREADRDGEGCLAAAADMMSELERCGDKVVGASRRLQSMESEQRMRGLQTLRQLPLEVLEAGVEAEAAAAAVVCELVIDLERSVEEQ